MRLVSVAVLTLAACGNVETKAVDAPVVQPDVPALCVDMSSVTSCGPTCATCSTTGDRQVATCNGQTCGTACVRNAPTCSDNSCSRTLWSFDAGMLDGVEARTPTNLALSIRSVGGSPALAVDVTNLTEVAFRIPVCLSGSVNVSPKTLSARVWFDGAGTTAGNFYVQASVPSPSGGFIGQDPAGGPAYQTLTWPFNMASQSATATDITFQVGTYGLAFSGTVWFDDITIQ